MSGRITVQDICLSAELARIHAVIDRGLDIAVEHTAQVEGAALPEALHLYVDTLLTVVEAHHHAEETLQYPLFRQRVPEVPYALLYSQHEVVNARLDAVDAALARSDEAGAIHAALVELRTRWDQHAREEERHLARPEFEVAFTVDELERLHHQATLHTRGFSRSPQLVLPFLLYHLDRHERRVFGRDLSRWLRRVVVPWTWRRHWRPIRPYLPHPPKGLRG